MDKPTLWSLFYFAVFLLMLWLVLRLIVWQTATWIKRKFDIDITIKSVGFFSFKEVAIRVSQLQTIEVDKVGLHFQLFNRNKSNRLISLKFGEVRVRSEISRISFNNGEKSQQSSNNADKSSNTNKNLDKWTKFFTFFFKHMSLHVDMLNIMVLHAFVPDSLLHLNIQKIHLASEKDLGVDSPAVMAGCISLASLEGKILKSRKEAAEVTSCIAEISTSVSIAVLVRQLEPCIELSLVNVDFTKLQIEIHEGALVPGIILPSIKTGTIETTKPSQNKLNLDKIQSRLSTIIAYLPFNFNLCINSFGVAFFGDETMGETTRGARVCCRKIYVTQAKDTNTMVPVVVETEERSEFKVPNGYIRLTFEDVAMTDYFKHKVAYMGRTVFETKLTANGVLSNSLDLTAWHIDYIHRESVEFWGIIFKKLEDAERQRIVLQEAAYYPSRSFADADSKVTSRNRIPSAPESLGHLGHPDILQGTEDAAFPDALHDQPQSTFSIMQVLKTIQINVVFECTIYDASFNGVMVPVEAATANQNLPCFTIGLDAFTGSVDQSPNSRDFNFMSKMDHFWCMVSRDSEPLLNKMDEEYNSNSSLRCEHEIHLWGRVFNLENISLYGSACIKAATEPRGCQEISFLVDAKVAGVQIEVSGCAAEALSSVLVTLMPETSDICGEEYRRPTYSRQTTSPDFASSMQRSRHQNSQSNYQVKLACLELELTRLNGFILSSDTASYADCFVARFDKIKAEITGSDDALNSGDGACVNRSINVVGVAITTVHNPAFSPFASYDSGGSLTPASQLPPSLRYQQTKAAQYRCVPAALMNPNNLSFDCLSVCYSTNFDSDMTGADGVLPINPQDRIRRQLSFNLTSEAEIVVRWTPALHALVHYSLVDFWTHLAPFFKPKRSSTCMRDSKSMHIPYKFKTNSVNNHGDHPMTAIPNRKPIQVQMFGDGSVDAQARSLDLDVNISTAMLHFCLTEKQSLKLCLTPLRCVLSDDVSIVTFDALDMVMDDKEILKCSNIMIEMAPSNDICNQDRSLFSDLKTPANRAWSFKFSSIHCFFPHKYNFAATFDLFITTFKWAKSLYRDKSHPFRSRRLPPDLYISIEQFLFDVEDWDFECHLRDNHELMKDEWTESEKRRSVLDQRMAELRKKRGEMLPAKKVEELYCRLEEESTKIYLTRCRDLYGFSNPPVFTMPHHSCPPSNASGSYYTRILDPSNYHPTSSRVFTWNIVNFTGTGGGVILSVGRNEYQHISREITKNVQ